MEKLKASEMSDLAEIKVTVEMKSGSKSYYTDPTSSPICRQYWLRHIILRFSCRRTLTCIEDESIANCSIVDCRRQINPPLMYDPLVIYLLEK